MQKDFHALFSLSIFKWFGKLTCACSVLWFHSFHLLLVVSDTIHWLFFCFCLYFITSLSHFVLRIRCPDGSHQLVWDAVSTDALQRVPQSGASAAGVSTGMRNFFLPQGTHSFPFPPNRRVASQLCFRCFLRDWTTCTLLSTSGFMSFLSVFLLNSFPSAHCVIIWLC